jgi:hypothetical protein
MNTAILSFCSILSSLNPAPCAPDREVLRAWKAAGPLAGEPSTGGVAILNSLMRSLS